MVIAVAVPATSIRPGNAKAIILFMGKLLSANWHAVMPSYPTQQKSSMRGFTLSPNRVFTRKHVHATRRLALPSDYSHFTVNLFTFASRRAALRFRALRAAKETPALVQLSDIGGRDNVAEFPEPILRAQLYKK